MKATIEFSLPEESHEHQTALDGGKWMSLLHGIDESLRSEAKHGADKRYRASEVRTMLHNAMAEYGLSFD